jgi:hypothetical protein
VEFTVFGHTLEIAGKVFLQGLEALPDLIPSENSITIGIDLGECFEENRPFI